MDGSTLDHSDSDSGESWTLLEHNENTPGHADDALEFQQNRTEDKRNTPEPNNEKDDDTDGISIISDSDPESTPCDVSYDRCLLADDHPTERNPQYISVNPVPNSNTVEHHETLRSENDFLGDSHTKHKTYVHRRNKRLSTVLNIIMLGSVITAAGVAIGHMWGARNECTMHTTPSVNKILSNLYKLQEENAYLRSKLKELTLVTNTQLQKKSGLDKLSMKQPRCRKFYEESLNNKIVDKITKCVDNEATESILKLNLIQPEYEKEFLSDIDKLKNVYQQNKSWLDDEVTKRMKNEKQAIKKLKSAIKSIHLSPVDEEKIEAKDENFVDITVSVSHTTKFGTLENLEHTSHKTDDVLEENNINKLETEKKISYADSLKSEQPIKRHQKRDTIDNIDKERKEHFKKRNKKSDEMIPDVAKSEEDFMKDNRYVEPKMKQERKKHDRQKLHKKQKRKNKYEQWEMKGGYMKDYDEFSITSSQENEHVLGKTANEIDDVPASKTKEIEVHKAKSDKHSSILDKDFEKKSKDGSWYEKRAALRTEARKKLEQELFGESSPNNGRWYFRRMQRREQCRAKGDNSTYRKQSKRNMNYKMKH